MITWRSPADEREVFARTLETIRWNGNNATVTRAVTRARRGLEATEWLAGELAARARPNGTFTLNRLEPHHAFNDLGHCTEQFGTAMAVSELLLQSVGDVLGVFPALPAMISSVFVPLTIDDNGLATIDTVAG